MQFLRNLLQRKDTTSEEDVVEPPVSTEDADAHTKLMVGWATDVGIVRGHNEDTALVLTSVHDGDDALPSFGLFVLADGMGGHKAGEVASSLAARAVVHHVTRELYLPILVSRERNTDQPALQEVLIDAVQAANDMVAEHVPGGGTTLTCAMLLGSRAYIAHVGDSRAYVVAQDGALDQITHDHSLVDRLVELGQLTRDEAAVHPQKNVLYRAVGQGGDLEVDTHTCTITDGERLLLCSDGLWGMLEETEIADIIQNAHALQCACEALVGAANKAGGRDNITAILVDPPVG